MFTKTKKLNTGIKDVASLAGVSISTVSRILNQGTAATKYTEFTIEKVRQVAQKLNYKPNQYAKRLANRCRSMPNIVVATPTPSGFGSMHNERVFAGIVETAAQRGVTVTVRHSVYNNNDQLTPLVLESIGDPELIDGIILHSWQPFATESKVKNELLALNIPFVVANHYCPDPKIPCVGGDFAVAGQEIAEYLIRLGHTRIAGMLGPTACALTDVFISGIKNAFLKHEIEFNPEMLVAENFDFVNEAKMHNIIDKFAPTAWITASDRLGLAMLGKLQDIGMKVPDDVSVVGFGNEFYSDLIRPRLTTADEHGFLIGIKTMEILYGLMRGETTQTKAKLHYQMVIRDTVRAPRL